MNSVAEALKAAKTVRDAMIALVDIRLTLVEIMSAAHDVPKNLNAHRHGDLADTDRIIQHTSGLDGAFEEMSRSLLCEHNGHCMGMPNGGGITPSQPSSKS